MKLITLLYNLYFIILLWAHCSCSCCCQLQNIFPRNSLLYIICGEVYLDKVLLRLYLSIYYEIVSFFVSNRLECYYIYIIFILSSILGNN